MTLPVPGGSGQEAPPAQAYLVVLAGARMGEMFKLTADRTVIGRSPQADIRILDDGISREHCEVVAGAGGHLLRDLGSTNGTVVKGVCVQEHALADGDKILVGSNTILKFTHHDALDETFQRQMFESALRDDLTKAFNKKYFMDRIESEFAYAMRHHIPLTLVSFDLDRFKQINDTHGHPVGDRVLQEAARRVQETIRVEDVFARVGGEEFSVICRGTDGKQGHIVAERIRAAIGARPVVLDEGTLPITVSVGLATVPGHGLKDAAAFIAAADRALYDSKHGGRDRTTVYRP